MDQIQVLCAVGKKRAVLQMGNTYVMIFSDINTNSLTVIERRSKMLPEARREHILTYIKNIKNVTSEELSKKFNVTEETIRKDLNFLSEKGLVIRTFGGAMIKDDYDPSLAQRTVSNLEEKKAIAKTASFLIKDRECIVLDAGSTTIELARYIRESSEVFVLTNSLEVINILSKVQGVNVISTGGTLRNKSMSFQGKLTEHSIGSYNIQKAFISAKGLGIEEGVMDTNELEASVKRKMIETAKEVILLADYSKFSKIAHVTVCPIEKITRIITDNKADPEILKKYRSMGIEVIVAG